MKTPEQIAAEANFGQPSAIKRGRRKEWPYVPIQLFPERRLARTKQMMGVAFATRAEAVAYAEKVIANLRADMLKKLREPRYRALRIQHGLPQEAADL